MTPERRQRSEDKGQRTKQTANSGWKASGRASPRRKKAVSTLGNLQKSKSRF